MERSSFADFSCSIARTLELIGEWWTVLILRDLFMGFDRFDEIQRDLGLASNVLSARLRRLLEHGIVERQADPADGRVLRYSLTEQGRELYPILLALTAWGDKWRAPGGKVPLQVRHAGCGQLTHAVPACAHCGEPLLLHELGFEPGPGGRAAPGTALVGQVLARRR
ncbi:MAG: helix-turn-helix domain-containing protein [Pseudomonadota bacterium]